MSIKGWRRLKPARLAVRRRPRVCPALIWLSVLAAGADGACVPEDVFKQANEQLGQHNYESAAHLLDNLRACPQLTPIERFQQGWLYGRSHRFDKALDVLSGVPRDVPDRVTHDYAIALSKFQLSDYDGAIHELEELRSSGPLDAKSANLLAVAHSKAGQLQKAYGVLMEEARLRPNLTTYLNLVTVCAEGGDYKNSAETAAKATALFPQSPEAWIAQGAADSLLGRLAEAHREFGLAVKLAPERADSRFFLALTAFNQGQYSEAIASLERAKQDGVNDSDLSYLLAECYLKTEPQNPGPPLTELNEAVKLNPESVPARTLRGRLLLEKQQVSEALADLEFAHRQDPNSRTAIYNLARAYQVSGKRTEAADLFKKLRSVKPDPVGDLGNERLQQTLRATQ